MDVLEAVVRVLKLRLESARKVQHQAYLSCSMIDHNVAAARVDELASTLKLIESTKELDTEIKTKQLMDNLENLNYIPPPPDEL